MLSNALFFVWLGWLGMFGAQAQEEKLTTILQRVEESLGSDSAGPYFLGDRFSYVDIMFVPYLERVAASFVYANGVDMRDGVRYPAIHAWFSAMETRESYQHSKTDYYTHAHNVPKSIGRYPLSSLGAAPRQEIDGGAWKVPLPERLIEPDWGWISTDAAHREAVERLINNQADVVRFAARGAGLPGFPPAAAELADPNAVPSQVWIPSIDMLLRHTAMLLLTGGDTESRAEERATALAGARDTVASIPLHACGTAAMCLEYLQRRVGVPRDMSLPAARCFRAELGCLIDLLRERDMKHEQ